MKSLLLIVWSFFVIGTVIYVCSAYPHTPFEVVMGIVVIGFVGSLFINFWEPRTKVSDLAERHKGSAGTGPTPGTSRTRFGDFARTVATPNSSPDHILAIQEQEKAFNETFDLERLAIEKAIELAKTRVRIESWVDQNPTHQRLYSEALSELKTAIALKKAVAQSSSSPEPTLTIPPLVAPDPGSDPRYSTLVMERHTDLLVKRAQYFNDIRNTLEKDSKLAKHVKEALEEFLKNGDGLWELIQPVDGRGAVLAPYQNSDAAQIRRFVEQRKISHLVHFTRIENLTNILRNGLIGRDELDLREQPYVFNDRLRLDRIANSICLSVSFPNYKMFYTYRCQDQNADWVVIRLKPDVLWSKKSVFCVRNAADKEVAQQSTAQRMSFQGFKNLFENQHGYPTRELTHIPSYYPTNPQAEVLVLESIDPTFIVDVCVDQQDKIRNQSLFNKVISESVDRTKFFRKRDYFYPRQDHNYW